MSDQTSVFLCLIVKLWKLSYATPKKVWWAKKKVDKKMNCSTEKRQIDLLNAINGTVYLSGETPTIHRHSV